MRAYFAFWLSLLLLVAGCRPAWVGAPVAAPMDTMAVPSPQPTPTLSIAGPSVADLMAHPPAAGQSVEIDAYFSGVAAPALPGGPPPPEGQIACPNAWEAALTDRPFTPMLALLNGVCSNELPAGEPWLIAVTEEMLKPGVRARPDLPYHARLRGYLGDPRTADCQWAERIFVVQQVIAVYPEKPPQPPALPAGRAAWPRRAIPAWGCSLPVPRGWRAEQLDDVTFALTAPEWPRYPVVLRVHPGETHYDQYDPAQASPLLQGEGWGVYEQGWASPAGEAGDVQGLAGYRVDRRPGTGERDVSVLFSAHGRTYELFLRYPTGYEAPQPLLSAYSAIVEGFRLDRPPEPSPTPPVHQALGAGPFITVEKALQGVQEAQEKESLQILSARLVSEAEAREVAGPCATFTGHPEGVWVLAVRGVFEGQLRTMRFFVDAATGSRLCGEEMPAGDAS